MDYDNVLDEPDLTHLGDLNAVLDEVSPQKAVLQNRFLLWMQRMKSEKRLPVAIEVKFYFL